MFKHMPEEEIRKSALYNVELHRLAHKIVDIIFEYADLSDKRDNSKPRLLDERFKQFEVIGHSRRSEGFILGLQYGKPTRLFTPWGGWCFARNDGMSCSYRKAWEAIVSKELAKRFNLTAIEIGEVFTNMALRKDSSYGINEVDGIEVPAPYDLGFDDRGEEAEAVWKYLQAEFVKNVNKVE